MVRFLSLLALAAVVPCDSFFGGNKEEGVFTVEFEVNLAKGRVRKFVMEVRHSAQSRRRLVP